MAGIVDSVLVDEDGADQSTELDECVPVAAVAGETRSFDSMHRTDQTLDKLGTQSANTCTGDAPDESSEMSIDDLNSLPAKLFGTIGKPILSSLAFKIVHELIRG